MVKLASLEKFADWVYSVSDLSCSFPNLCSIYVFVLIGVCSFKSPGFDFLAGFVCLQLFFSYFKDLVGREVTVELKNDLAIRGTLHSVDQYLNIKLENTRVVDQDKYPHMVCTQTVSLLNL